MIKVGKYLVDEKVAKKELAKPKDDTMHIVHVTKYGHVHTFRNGICGYKLSNGKRI